MWGNKTEEELEKKLIFEAINKMNVHVQFVILGKFKATGRDTGSTALLVCNYS